MEGGEYISVCLIYGLGTEKTSSATTEWWFVKFSIICAFLPKLSDFGVLWTCLLEILGIIVSIDPMNTWLGKTALDTDITKYNLLCCMEDAFTGLLVIFLQDCPWVMGRMCLSSNNYERCWILPKHSFATIANLCNMLYMQVRVALSYCLGLARLNGW